MKKPKKMKQGMLVVLSGTLVLSGFITELPAFAFRNLPAAVMAADGQIYVTSNGIATFGAGQAGIKISGNAGQTLVGKKFNVYKLFNAENSRDEESINYTFNPEYEQPLKNVVAKALSTSEKPVTAEEVTEYMAIDYIQSLNTNLVEGAKSEQELEGRYSQFRYFVENIRDEILKMNIKPDVVDVKDTDENNSVQLNGLEFGYYIVDEVSAVADTHSAGSLCMVDTANPTSEISVKSDYPDVIKKIQEDDANKDIKDSEGWNDIADFEIGQTVPYKFESDIPDMNGYDTYYYAWHDKMDPALTFNTGSVSVVIKGNDGSGQTKEYKLTPDEFKIVTPENGEETFNVVIDDIKAIVDREFDQKNELNENVYGQSVALTFDAVLNENAAEKTGRPGYENDVRLEFSNDADTDHAGSKGFTPWDTVVCFTYKINVEKLNDHQKSLAGAKFRIYSDKECKNEVYVKEGNAGYIVINRDAAGGNDHTGGTAPQEAVEMVSPEDGRFIIFGLDSGTYYLKETKAPDGYRLLEKPVTISVKPTFTTSRDNYVKGNGATEETLQKLEATAHVESFYDGLTGKEEQNLTTDVQDGSMNLTVVNKVGKKLPVTGTSAVLIMLTAGAGMMTWAVAKNRKKKEK